jgi:hypothetical protein
MDLFRQLNAQVHVTWYNVDEEHAVITDAMHQLGGVSAIYQRSLELVPAPEAATSADVVFRFSGFNAGSEVAGGSRMGYRVVTGYLGDHRFGLLRGDAAAIRADLRNNGAEFIMAYFDENSAADERWHGGHHMQRENYAFLLEKVLEHEWFGLVLKPKLPGTLRSRLGPVAGLMAQAIRTGRCFLFEGGRLHSKFPPAAAALVADIAVHGHFFAATAGLEAALAGVPTLLVDREGWPNHPLYGLGAGQVVFRDWNDLWTAVGAHRHSRGGLPGFGDWSTMLDQLDPFRDGRASERMGQYLQWLLNGLKQGLNRDMALAQAAERYAVIWGHDKVRTYRPDVNRPVTEVARA